MKYIKIIFVIFITLLLQIHTSTYLWAEKPGELVMTTIERGLTVLKDPSLNGEDKLQERKQKLWDEISPLFNFEEMSKRSLGKYWRKRSLEEKREFVELFTNILKDTYIGKTDSYSNEKIIYLREKQRDNRTKVQTIFITSTGKEVSVDFSLLSNSGKWKIYDAVIEGVSLVNNYRNQFNNILVKSSYEELVKKIKQKQSKTSTN